MDLILDTSSEKLRVILKTPKTVYASKESNPKHLKNLLPEIDKVLLSAEKKLTDVDTIAVVLGPGSFTGVRIGVSTVKAFLSVFNDKKMVGINLFELLSYAISSKEKIDGEYYIIIKSTSSKFYFAKVSKGGKIEEMGMMQIDQLAYKTNGKKVYYYLKDNSDLGIKTIDVQADDEDFIAFVKKQKDKKNFVSLADIRPIYLALSQAEEELLKKENNAKNS